MKKIISVLGLLFLNKLYSQNVDCENIYNAIFCEKFENIDNWIGDKNKFTLDNGILKNDDIEAGNSYISLPYSIKEKNTLTWSFNLELRFNPTSNNYTDVYLISDTENPNNSNDAMILRFGHDSKDMIRLAKKVKGSSGLKYIISTSEDFLDNSDNIINIFVHYNNGEWKLEISNNEKTFNGTSNELLHIEEGYFSIKNKYTKTNAKGILLSSLYSNFIEVEEKINCLDITKSIICEESNNLSNWEGDTEKYKVENNKLKLNDSRNGESYIFQKYLTKLPNGEIKWNFDIELNFNPSSSNITEIYLISDSLNPKKSQNAFFLKIGDGDDWIRLARKKNGSNRYFISSEKKILDNSSNKIHIEITLDKEDKWEMKFILNNRLIFSDFNYEDLFIREGYFSYYNEYNTSGIEGGFSLNNLYAQLLDNEKPKITKVAVKNSNTIRIIFSEDIDEFSSKKLINYNLENIGNPKEIIYLNNTVDLIYDEKLPNGERLKLEVKDIEDLSQNIIDIYNEELFIRISDNYNIVISEFMPNPSPPIYLPNSEYIELYNNENFDVNILNWRLNILEKEYKIDTSLILKKETYLVFIFSKDYLSHFENTINKVYLKDLPSIPNISETKNNITIYNDLDEKIDGVVYDRFLLSNSKSTGGWSLERKDLDNKCINDNWDFSIDKRGGTPAEKNSISQKLQNKNNFFVRELGVQEDRKSIKIFFSDFLNDINNFNFKLSEGVNLDTIIYNNNILNEIEIRLKNSVEINSLYSIEILDEVMACGEKNLMEKEFNFGLTDHPQKGELLINEILYNPNDKGENFIEIYNNSDRFLNLRDIKLCVIKNDNISSEVLTSNHIIMPNKYAYFTKNINGISKYYEYNKSNFFEISKMPNMSISNDRIAITTRGLDIIDEMVYNDNMHFRGNDNKGISLERINFEESGLNENNWTSAISSYGYATPGNENSQNTNNKNYFDSEVEIINKTFIFNNGEPEKPLEVNYNFNENILASVKIYNSKGILIDSILENEQLNTKGKIFWKGDNLNNIKLDSGIYILHLEGYSNSGKTYDIKKAFTLGNR